MARSDLDSSIIEAFFMHVHDGYIFRYSPWAPFCVALAGPSRHFRLDESQKIEIAGDLLLARKKRRTSGSFWGGAAIVIFLAGAIWLAANDYSRSLLIPLTILAAAPIYLYVRHCYVRALRPLLDGLPRSSARITFRKRIQKFSSTVPLSFLLVRLTLFTGLSVLSLIWVIRAIATTEWMASLVLAAMLTAAFIVLTVYYSCLIVLRAASATSTLHSDPVKM